MRRQGLTLVEMMVAIVIFGLVAATLNRVFAAQQRLAVAQVEQASVQSNIRSGSAIVAGELWELATDTAGSSDILAFDAAGLTYRATRTLGLACQVSRTETRIRTSPLYQYRSIVPGQDGLLLWVEGNPDISSDDRWLRLSITAVANGSDCGGAPAIALTTSPIDTLTTPLSSIVPDAPIRSYETMELRAVMEGAQNWLGARSVSGGETIVKPVAGPVTSNGVRFAYLDSLGAATSVAGRIRSIRISLYGESERAVRSHRNPVAVQPIQDSLITTVTLRNAPLH
jgi:prepilin-type N-terminal cleavage/methylation domain-containing protein